MVLEWVIIIPIRLKLPTGRIDGWKEKIEAKANTKPNYLQ
jgi:hypothetical protein